MNKAFITHYNYVSCLNSLSKGLTVECGLNIRNRIRESTHLAKKITLIKLIKNNLEAEYNLVLRNPDFAEVCVPWIAVKTYYLLFNLQVITKYLITGNASAFYSTHKALLNNIKSSIKQKTLYFNKDPFNNIYPCSEVRNFRVPSGYNIRFLNVDSETRFRQTLKKLLEYKIEDFKRDKKIINFRNKKDKEALKKFISMSNLNIYEFFYWYRIKSNYRDLEFLDKNISSAKFNDFYKNYFELTVNFYKAFEGLINDLARKRLGKEILKIVICNSKFIKKMQ